MQLKTNSTCGDLWSYIYDALSYHSSNLSLIALEIMRLLVRTFDVTSNKTKRHWQYPSISDEHIVILGKIVPSKIIGLWNI